MTRVILILTFSALAIACGSGPSTSTAPKTNVGSPNSAPYTSREDDYRFALRNLDLYPLEGFVGKTATEMKLWDNKPVVKILKSLLGPEYTTMVKSWKTETPMKRFGDVLMLSGCERDNCTNNRYVIITSLSEGYVHVVHIGDERTREWRSRSSDDLNQLLPSPFAEELRKWKSRD